MFGFNALFGLGETVLAPTTGPLANRLTDNTIRGRANSLAALSQSLAFIVCPALATGFIAAGCSRSLDWPVVRRLPRHGRRQGQATPRADLGPGLRDRSARAPA